MEAAFICSEELWSRGFGGGHPLKPERPRRTYELLAAYGAFDAPDLRVLSRPRLTQISKSPRLNNRLRNPMLMTLSTWWTVLAWLKPMILTAYLLDIGMKVQAGPYHTHSTASLATLTKRSSKPSRSRNLMTWPTRFESEP